MSGREDNIDIVTNCEFRNGFRRIEVSCPPKVVWLPGAVRVAPWKMTDRRSKPSGRRRFGYLGIQNYFAASTLQRPQQIVLLLDMCSVENEPAKAQPAGRNQALELAVAGMPYA
jgi:hypothetical protein